MRQFTVLAGWCLIAAMVAAPVAARAAEPAADAMDIARQKLVSFEWVDAYEHFDAIAQGETSGSDRWVQATFGAAVALSHLQPQDREHIEQAQGLYRQIVEKAPDSKYLPRVMMNQGRLQELRDYPGDTPDLDAARETYLKVAAKWPDQPIAGEATFRAAATLVQTYDVANGYTKLKQGIAMLEKWLADHPQEPMASAMWQYLGDAYFFPLDDSVNAMRCYDTADKLGWTDKGNAGPILWRCAALSERNKNTGRAIYYYTKIITDAPNSGKAYESQLALKRLGAPVPEINIFRSRKAPSTTQDAAPATRTAAPTTQTVER